MERRPKAGFTLVELLAVIVILGILIALLLPAVNGKHEASTRLECANNLKQMGLAVHNFHETYGIIPPARWADGHPTFFVLLMPFMEQKQVYELWDTGKPYAHGSNAVARKQLIPAYTCPARRNGSISNTVVPRAIGDYAGCAGNNLRGESAKIEPWYSNPDVEGMRAPESVGVMVTDRTFDKSHFSLGLRDEDRIANISHLSFRNVADGLSKTLLIGEKHVTIDGQLELPGDGSIYNSSRMDNFCRAAGFSGDPRNPEYLNLARGPDDTAFCQVGGTSCDSFGSWHSGVVQFVMGDGSVQKIKVDIDIDVLDTLAVRDDRRQIPANY